MTSRLAHEALDWIIETLHELWMERPLRLRVAYAPTRLAAEHLRHAYERVVPVTRRTFRDTSMPTIVPAGAIPVRRKEQSG